MKGNCNIRAMNPRELGEEQFLRLHEITQDMWADGIGEFVQCTCCHKMMSKQDIFGHLAKDVYDETTQKIIDILGIKNISCPACFGETQMVYGDENIESIQSRLLDTKDSFLVVCENTQGDIVGYMDGYVETPENIFERELSNHYFDIGFDEIKKRVGETLGYVPNEMISFSSLGLLAEYRSFFTIFHTYKAFSDAVPQDYFLTPGITELDKNNNLYFIYKNMHSKSLEISDCEILKQKIKNTGENYKSDIVVFDHPAKNFKENFSMGIRDFLKKAQR